MLDKAGANSAQHFGVALVLERAVIIESVSCTTDRALLADDLRAHIHQNGA